MDFLERDIIFCMTCNNITVASCLNDEETRNEALMRLRDESRHAGHEFRWVPVSDFYGEKETMGIRTSDRQYFDGLVTKNGGVLFYFDAGIDNESDYVGSAG